MIATEMSPDLAARVAALNALAAEPASEVYLPADRLDVEAWNYVGDPLCDDLITLMRSRKLMGGDIFANARALQAEGVPEAVAFFADVEAVPSWLDFDQLRAGAEMGRRNPLGLMFGLHGALPFTYHDPATSKVMANTGRLANGGDFRRRFWETATGFIGALDVDAMKPGGKSWEAWVRIRFMHTMIRLGIERAGNWDLPCAPISQVPSACTAHMFGPYRVNVIRYFGGVVSQEEADSFSLMWRWVARIEGVNNQLLGRTTEEQFHLQKVMHGFLFDPTEDARVMTDAVITGAATIPEFGMSRRLHSAVVRNIMTEQMVEVLPGIDLGAALGVPEDRRAQAAINALSKTLKGANQVMRIPGVKPIAARGGWRLVNVMIERGLAGKSADYRGAPVGGQPTDE